MKHARSLLCVAFLLGTFAPSVRPQSPDLPATVRQQNAQVLDLYGRQTSERTFQRAFDPQDVESLVRERAQALLALMRENPREALKLGLPEVVTAGLRRTFPEAASWLEQSGEWTGIAEVDILDDFDGENSRLVVRLRGEGEEILLHFPDGEAPQMQCSGELTVQGLKLAGEMAVASSSYAAGAGAAAVCTPTGPQQTLVILAKFPGYADFFTADYARSVVFADGGALSLNNYWREVSGGQTSALGSVLGWVTLDRVYSCSEYGNLREAALQAADALVDLTQFTRILIYFPSPGSCYFAGVSTVGCTYVSGRYGLSMASLSMMVANYSTPLTRGVQVTAHEAGHALGLHHSASRDFGAEPLGPPGAPGTVSAYGDNFSTMGYWNLGHYPAPMKRALGWWTPGDQIQTVQSNGTYNIAPAELASGPAQALKVQRGAGSNNWLWLEYRRPIGMYDSTLRSQVFSGVLVHYEDGGSAMSHVLDYSPGSADWYGPALAAGATWQDPYSSLIITVVSATESAAVVTVSYGAAPCTRAAPTLGLSPATASAAAGQAINYAVSLKNNDSSACAASTFSLLATTPAGWSGSVAPATAALAPGQNATATLTVTAPLAAAAATYSVGVQAGDGTRTQSATAGVTIVPPACTRAAPGLALLPAGASAAAGQAITYSLSLKNNDSSTCAPSAFSLRATTPAGWSGSVAPATVTLAPGQSATAALTVTAPLAAAAATYSVGVQASDGARTQSATAGVTILPPGCTRSAPGLGLSPATASAAPGATLTYSLSLKNNDSSACAASTFTWQATLPAGWTGTVAPATATLAAGQSATAALTVSVSQSAAAATYSVGARAADPLRTQSATAGLTVVPPQSGPLAVSLQVTPSAPVVNTKVTFRASVTQGGQAKSGVPVTIVLTLPDGGVNSIQLTTSTSGVASIGLHLRQAGIHSAYATVNDAGVTRRSGTVQVTVK